MATSRLLPRLILLGAVLLAPDVAFAQTAEQFVEAQHAQITALLKQPASPQRNAQLDSSVDRMIDYDEMTRRCFNAHWNNLSPAEQADVTRLLRDIVRANYRKNLRRTLDYKTNYVGTAAHGSSTLVRTQATSLYNARDPVVQIDYVVAGSSSGPFRVVDIVTENSSLTNNYYRDFHRFLTTPGQGYPYLVQKLRTKLARLQAPTAPTPPVPTATARANTTP